MRYVPPFASLNHDFVFGSDDGAPWVKIGYNQFEALLRKILAAVEFDEEWYRKQYPDVDEAVREGLVKSGREHFINSGYFEGRLPGEVEVDEEWYFETYPDIAEAVTSGEIASAQQHFLAFGYAEGRQPAP
ncbi:hypothetical protein [Paracoccus ravus]|uniref:hypothetical protein n=1 Tax=Paracoccus ravus TaxID=2447760 RepID=UPI00106EA582|nr:hypothetical protein [Paracoccus ravus]